MKILPLKNDEFGVIREVFVHLVEMEDTLNFKSTIGKVKNALEISLRSRGNDGMTKTVAFEMQVEGKRGCLEPGDGKRTRINPS